MEIFFIYMKIICETRWYLFELADISKNRPLSFLGNGNFMNEKFNKRNFFSVLFVATIDNFGFGIVLVMFAPLIFSPDYAIVSQGLSLDTKNLLLACSTAAFPLTQFVGASLAGAYADRAGRKKALLLTLTGTFVGYVFSALAVHASSIGLLILSRLVAGFFAGNIAICLAILADMTDKGKSRGKMYGNLTIVYGFSWSLSIVVGGFLSNREICPLFNPSIPFWVTAVITLAAYWIVQKFLIDSVPVNRSASYQIKKELMDVLTAFKQKGTSLCLLLILAWSFGWCLATQWYSAYSIQKFSASESAIAVCFLAQGIFWALGGSLFNTFLLKRFSIPKVAMLGFGITMIGLFAVRIFDTFSALTGILSVTSLTAVLAMSNSLTLLSISSSDDKQGAAMGLGQSVIALGLIIIPFLGALISSIDLNFLYPVCGLILLMAVCLIGWKYRQNTEGAKD